MQEVQLTASGRPCLVAGEVEIKSEAGVCVYDKSGKIVLLERCEVVLTNYRMLFLTFSAGHASSKGQKIDLSIVQSIVDLAGLFRSSKRFRLQFDNNSIELKFLEGRKYLIHTKSAVL